MPEGPAGDLMKATVPGCDKTVLLENGLIEDPFLGRNLERSSWSEKHSWDSGKNSVFPRKCLPCGRYGSVLKELIIRQ